MRGNLYRSSASAEVESRVCYKDGSQAVVFSLSYRSHYSHKFSLHGGVFEGQHTVIGNKSSACFTPCALDIAVFSPKIRSSQEETTTHFPVRFSNPGNNLFLNLLPSGHDPLSVSHGCLLG